MKLINSKLKGFVRIDGSGRLVPNSLIMRQKKPMCGKWMEISNPYMNCFSSTTSTTTTIIN